MSASSKKKLRREQEAAKLTERQLTEQKEAKKLNLYTTLFVAVLVVLLVVAATVGTMNTIKNSGIRERNTVAVTIGSHEVNNVEMNYFYIDAINSFLSQYGSYASLFGLDTHLPLNEQMVNEESGQTWADDFLENATENAKSVYALLDEANAAGFTMPADRQTEIDYMASNIQLYASLYGYADADSYLKAMYGNGSSLESYIQYMTNSTLADAYYNAYAQGLTYEDDELRAAEAENYNEYSSFSYNYYYLAANKFLEGGTESEDGVLTFSDEEKAASVEAAKAAADSLVADTVDSVETFDALINALSINEGSEVSSTACDDFLSSSVLSVASDWITDESRAEGDMTVIPSTSTSTDADGNEVTTTNGYYVVYFRGSNDNTYPLANVRHILVSFEGGTYDETTGTTTYSDEEKAAAWTAAEEILNTWKSGEATEESFAALANEKSTDTGSNTNGGLYEGIYPGQMVDEFENWCFDNRKVGDTGMVETTYGVHIMYYSGDHETTYRDYMITSKLMAEDITEWNDALLAAVTVTEGNTKYIAKDIVLEQDHDHDHDHE
ncbi:MAG: peptidylprolyl isomerase [Oscillospiraceae bacterium]|nr:peptidylprolyl isomerase [Oscillospiraceae bacterium]